MSLTENSQGVNLDSSTSKYEASSGTTLLVQSGCDATKPSGDAASLDAKLVSAKVNRLDGGKAAE